MNSQTVLGTSSDSWCSGQSRGSLGFDEPPSRASG